jgi:hypothetical protein
VPLRPFSGSTWIAFLDICGFKHILSHDNIRAREILNKFYNTVYKSTKLYHLNTNVGQTKSLYLNSIMVSDCAVIFIDNRRLKTNQTRDLNAMLWTISSINRKLISPVNGPQILTTCAVCYGKFKYEKRDEDEHIDKSFFYGEGYLDAYSKSTELNEKPGYVKVFKKDFQENIIYKRGTLRLLEELRDSYDFYWMTAHPKDIKHFKEEYDRLLQFHIPPTEQFYEEIKSLLYRTSLQTEIQLPDN